MSDESSRAGSFQDGPEYLRFRSVHPNVQGLKVGIFGLVNVLGRHGMLTPEEERFRRENNDWYDAVFPEPPIYRSEVDRRAVAWFKSAGSAELMRRVCGYLAILDAHRIAWEAVRSAQPGLIIYEDAFQVVAIPPIPGGRNDS
ncbi:MAG TPA: hypothetical protein VFQ44_17285 [Streptosporangiaceae bacterium]|nr:hypothetical protein [Streptosporangiaceae bacterium]